MGKNMTVWFVAGFLVLATVGVIVAAVLSGGQTGGANPFTIPAPAVTGEDWSKGPADAPVTLIEYGDYQCPACASYHALIDRLLEEYPTQLRFVFRDFPLYTIHANAGISAQAAAAAGLQGKYWEMYDLLYENQNAWDGVPTNQVVARYFDEYARTIGLDLDRFHSDMNSDQVLRMIKTNVDGANAIQVTGTPTFYVNLQRIQNPATYDALKAIIDNALASS